MTFWTEERLGRLRELAPTKSGAEIARELGTTRNAVLGCAHRKGITLHHPNKEREQSAAFRAMARSGGRRGKRLPADHPSCRHRPKGSHAFTLRQRAAAVAALMAGASYRVAGELVGASKVTVRGLWRHDPEVLATAETIYEAARQDAARRLRARRELLALQHRAAMAHNDRIISGFGERNKAIVRRKCQGENLAAIARDYGITRERARQVLKRAIDMGIVAPPGVNLLRDQALVS